MMKRHLPALCGLLALCACREPVVETEHATVSAALLDDERFNLITAFDFFAFEKSDTFNCARLLQTNLALDLKRDATNERARKCVDQDSAEAVSRVLGKVTEGQRVILVIGTRTPGACTTDRREEVDVPGQPLAVGCEEMAVTGGANHRVDIKLFPHRDPPSATTP
ncbi:MAG: hypothetical protein AB2A00_26340 [Myxococcota bacterium]